MKIALIAAIDENNGIGKDNKLLCHLSSDLKRFKELTTGHCIVMGRKTFESLPNGPLPNRKNIVITQNSNYIANGAYIANSVNEAIKLSEKDKICFIIGGEQIYKLFIDVADILHITKIHHQFDADAFFPAFNIENWNLLENIYNENDAKNAFPFSFRTYSRKR
jgi:dihydrofolate reductase